MYDPLVTIETTSMFGKYAIELQMLLPLMWTYLSRRKCVFEEEEGGIHFEDALEHRLTTYRPACFFQ